MSFILALDQGTTSSRAAVVNQEGVIVGLSQCPFQQYFPKPGWVEHDAEEIWRSQSEVIDGALRAAKLSKKDITGIGITNQRETTVIWERESGKPIGPAIVWQDRRTAAACEVLKQTYLQEIQDSTGLIPDSYFSASKIQWLLQNTSGAIKKAKQGLLAFGTIESWLIYNLTEKKEHVTDVTNASRTMLFNIRNMAWDQKLLSLFDIPIEILPKVIPSKGMFGEFEGIPIAGCAGDQQAALFGQGCFETGTAKNTYGTGCFLLLNTGEKIVKSRHNLLSTVASTVDTKTSYALEGSVFIGGAAVQWVRDGLGLVKASRDIEALALSVPDNEGVYFVPAFVGLGAPYWDQDARGAIVGLTRGTTKGHIARATIDAIAHQVADVVTAMEEDSGVILSELKVDGGASANDLLMQTQADLLNRKIVRANNLESTVMGAAFLAGLQVGVWKNFSELKILMGKGKTFVPETTDNWRREKREGWKRAVAQVLTRT